MSNKLDVFPEFLGKSANMVHRAEGLLVYANKEPTVKAICHSLFIYYLIYASQPPYRVGIYDCHFTDEEIKTQRS